MKSLKVTKPEVSPVAIKSLPGDVAVWVFICAELLVFGIFFISYAITHHYHVELFNHFQKTLNTQSGAINTVILIVASYFVVLAIENLKMAESKRASLWFWAAFVMGCAFVVNKSMEFHEHFSQGVRLSSNLFYMFYLSMTFFHYMHVILGMIILFVLARRSAKGEYGPDNLNGAISGGAYWHMVDLVWIILFPLIYVMK